MAKIKLVKEPEFAAWQAKLEAASLMWEGLLMGRRFDKSTEENNWILRGEINSKMIILDTGSW